MLEIKFSPGTHVSKAAERLVIDAIAYQQTCTGEFNGIIMVANPGDSYESVKDAWQRESNSRAEAYRNSPEGKRAAQEAEDRKNNCQAAVDELMLRFETLDYENLDELVQFFDDMTDPSDHIGVSFDHERIIETFAKYGYVASMNSEDKFDGDDRENYGKYLIGQALSGLISIGAIHPIYHKFYSEWRDKFTTV